MQFKTVIFLVFENEETALLYGLNDIMRYCSRKHTELVKDKGRLFIFKAKNELTARDAPLQSNWLTFIPCMMYN